MLYFFCSMCVKKKSIVSTLLQKKLFTLFYPPSDPLLKNRNHFFCEMLMIKRASRQTSYLWLYANKNWMKFCIFLLKQKILRQRRWNYSYFNQIFKKKPLRKRLWRLIQRRYYSLIKIMYYYFSTLLKKFCQTIFDQKSTFFQSIFECTSWFIYL